MLNGSTNGIVWSMRVNNVEQDTGTILDTNVYDREWTLELQQGDTVTWLNSNNGGWGADDFKSRFLLTTETSVAEPVIV